MFSKSSYVHRWSRKYLKTMKQLSNLHVCSLVLEIELREIVFFKFLQINIFYFQDKDDAFFCCNLGDIVKKYQQFAANLSEVQPYYGRNAFTFLGAHTVFKCSTLHQGVNVCSNPSLVTNLSLFKLQFEVRAAFRKDNVFYHFCFQP